MRDRFLMIRQTLISETLDQLVSQVWSLFSTVMTVFWVTVIGLVIWGCLTCSV